MCRPSKPRVPSRLNNIVISPRALLQCVAWQLISTWALKFTETIMGKGNNSQKNDKKGMKPKQDKKKGTKAESKK